MPDYQVGSLCDDCLKFGIENYLKLFYINLEEQIIKCESSACMFPYLRKPFHTNSTDSKPLNCTLSLDEFIQESFKQMEEQPTKYETNKCTTETDKASVSFDFSSIFMDNPVKTEIKEKPIVCESIALKNCFKNEANEKSSVAIPQITKRNTLKTEDSTSHTFIKPKVLEKTNLKNKKRISRCLSDVKTNPLKSGAGDTKKLMKSPEKEPVFVIEPQSGRSMKPLDLIKRYVKGRQNQC